MEPHRGRVGMDLIHQPYSKNVPFFCCCMLESNRSTTRTHAASSTDRDAKPTKSAIFNHHISSLCLIPIHFCWFEILVLLRYTNTALPFSFWHLVSCEFAVRPLYIAIKCLFNQQITPKCLYPALLFIKKKVYLVFWISHLTFKKSSFWAQTRSRVD